MNDQIRAAYRQLETEARNYADPDRAIATAKRRRRLATAVASASALAVVVVSAGAVAALRSDGTGPPLPPAASQPPAVTAASPGTVQPPSKLERLPSAAVGHAALAYSACFSGCEAFVVLTDGRQFVVPPDPRGVFAGTLTLSPDGRWLGYPISHNYLVRDLTGTRVHEIKRGSAEGSVNAWAWSADSSRLLLADNRDGAVTNHVLLNLSTGTKTGPVVPPDATAVGVLPDGALLLLEARQPGSGAAVRLSTSAGTAFTVNAADRLKADESFGASGFAHLARDGRSAYLIAGVTSPDEPRPTAVIHVDLSGTVLGRYDVPNSGARERWYAIGVSQDGFVFGWQTNRDGSEVTVLVTISAAGRFDGAVLPHEAVVRTPGTARY